MNKKIISVFMATTMLITCLFGCTNASTDTVEKITSETPYYYVTSGTIIKDRNHYMEIEVKMPKIKYYNEETDPVFDPINKEIEETITKIVDESKKNAYDTYMAYLESAKANVENEKAKKIQELKSKYKNILTDDEVKAIRELEDDEIMNIATESFLNIDAFSNTEDILNEGPHNKKIIVVDNTKNVENNSSNELKQATVKIEGKPGNTQNNTNQIVSDPKKFYNNETIVSTTNSTANKEKTREKNVVDAEVKETKKPTTKKPKSKDDSNFKPKMRFGERFSTPSELEFDNEITDEISLENFYKELRMIKRLHVPNKMSLTMSYIPTYIYCDFDVKCLDEDYISLYINFYETRNQTSSKVLFYNIDLKNKKLLSIKDVLGDEYKDICLKSINNSIENLTEDKKSLLTTKYNIEDFINENTTFFINNNHMPVVVFDKYMIAAGAAGYPEFQIVK